MLILTSVAMASNDGPWKLQTQKSGVTKTQLMSALALTTGVSAIPVIYQAAAKVRDMGTGQLSRLGMTTI